MFSVTFYFTYSLFVAQILGPDSGWQPIPLTEVITAAAAKKAYRRATLCVHPDKLQQRGASIQQKYVCEKVFDLLKVCDFLDTGPCLLIFLFSHSTWQSASLWLLLLETLIYLGHVLEEIIGYPSISCGAGSMEQVQLRRAISRNLYVTMLGR